MTIGDLKGKKVGICVSGGLDSKTVAKRLVEAGIDVLCFTADLAQPDEKDINDISKRMSECGVKTIIVDLKDEIARESLELIKSQAFYDGGYWNTTGLARAVTVKGLLQEMEKYSCNVLAHGATGRGNDQMRFERYTKVLQPDFLVYAPWRDKKLLKEFPGRKEMAEYLNKFSIPAVVGLSKRYSTDANLAGISYEAEDLESLETPQTIVEPKMTLWPHQCPDKKIETTIVFEKGIAVKFNGEVCTPLKILQKANAIAGANGIGLKHALENRIIGTKSRGVYEAPGMELLATCLEFIYQAVMDKKSRDLFEYLSRFIAKQIYEGFYYDPSTNAAKKAIDSLAQYASGCIKVELYKGNIYFKSLVNCPASLYNQADASMESSKGLNPKSSQGYADILSVEAISLAKAKQINCSYD